MSFGPEEDAGEYLPPSRTGTNRALLPGIFLIIVGVVNLLMSAGGGVMGFTFGQMPQADLQKAFDDLKADQRDAMKQMGVNSAEDLRSLYVRWGYGAGVVWAVAALFSLLGGILMCIRKARGLAIVGAIIATIPCLSPSSCPCLFGMGIGIWALVVLFSEDVKEAFR